MVEAGAGADIPRIMTMEPQNMSSEKASIMNLFEKWFMSCDPERLRPYRSETGQAYQSAWIQAEYRIFEAGYRAYQQDLAARDAN
jgi:hypothetical protein